MNNTRKTIKYNDFSIAYEKYCLENGLEVILHENHRNPIVAIAIQYHVGSNRELQGKTGFAHLFEHLLFQRSEHLKRNDFFNKISDLGGTFNGGTWEDGTIYYESVPNDALEKILWMESDRMGYFINTVTKKGIEREKDIVCNEKRQTVDNNPYGHTNNVIREALYPANHPYHWTVIGNMDDLRSASLDDVLDFYYKWYQPNNATLAISGDFNVEDTKKLIEKYFGEIKSNKKNPPNIVNIPVLNKEIRLFHEDCYANMPELNIVFPSPEQYNKDVYALDILSELLSDGKKAPLYKEIVEKNIAPDIIMSTSPREICGETTIKVKTYPGISLDTAYEAIQRAFKSFEQNGIDKKDIERYKKLAEIQFYQGFSSNLYVAMNIAIENVFGGSPDMIIKELELMQSITAEDIINVYNKYIKNKFFVATSFVPKGQLNLALSNSEKANIIIEKNDEQILNSEKGAIIDEPYPLSQSSFDRSIEPKLSILNPIKNPSIQTAKTKNGINIYLINQNDLPLVNFSFIMKAGSIDCDFDKAGVASLTAQMLNEGTEIKTPQELEDAFRDLGTELNIKTFKEYTSFNIICLSKDFVKAIKLIDEVFSKPRWDNNEYKRLYNNTLALIEQSLADPIQLGQNEFAKAIFGNNIIALPTEGCKESLYNITIDDIKKFYKSYYSPINCDLVVTGSINIDEINSAMESFGNNWNAIKTITHNPLPKFTTSKNFINTVNYPNAQQSFILIGNIAMSRNHPDYTKGTIANYKLGDGSGGQLFKILRLEHGFTYGAYSFFTSYKSFGFFRAYANVQSSVTKDALELFIKTIQEYLAKYSKDDLEATKNAQLRKLSRQYETLDALKNVLINISVANMPLNYIDNEIDILNNITYDETINIINKYLKIDNMKCVIVGDNKIINKLKEIYIK